MNTKEVSEAVLCNDLEVFEQRSQKIVTRYYIGRYKNSTTCQTKTVFFSAARYRAGGFSFDKPDTVYVFNLTQPTLVRKKQRQQTITVVKIVLFTTALFWFFFIFI